VLATSPDLVLGPVILAAKPLVQEQAGVLRELPLLLGEAPVACRDVQAAGYQGQIAERIDDRLPDCSLR
jgi:hypothetical protein